MLRWLKAKVGSRIDRRVREEVGRQLEYLVPQLIDFGASPADRRSTFHDRTRDPGGNAEYFRALKERLVAAGVPVEETDVDLADFERWLAEFPEIEAPYAEYRGVSIEKCLEHYLAHRHLAIGTGDTYIDVAAGASHFADALRKRGVKTFVMDLAYPEGVHGARIGADAGNTGLPDGFASVLSAQCAFECLMGDADVRFVREAGRILNGRGRFGIIPLYLDDTYFVATSPFCDQREVFIEPEAKRVWRDDEYREPFSRHYSPEAFAARVLSSLPDGMRGRVLYFRNLAGIAGRFPGERIYCHFMFIGEKESRAAGGGDAPGAPTSARRRP
jgi:hypothetical protein